jgi:hypothetical protein
VGDFRKPPVTVTKYVPKTLKEIMAKGTDDFKYVYSKP